MKFLEPKDLIPYLPYDLKVKHASRPGNIKKEAIINIPDFTWLFRQNYFKPILRPLIDFDNKINVNGKCISPIDELAELFKLNCAEYCWIKENLPFTNKFVKSYRYEIVQKLLEWHFDIFGLIDVGLAVPLNKA